MVVERMKNLIEKIQKIKLGRKDDKFHRELDRAFRIISTEIEPAHKEFLREDFELFRSRGRYIVNNTFMGGIIFLREPETIERIKIDFKTDTNSALAEVEYGSEIRNKRNVKYKPNAGKIESVEWSMLGIFPNFFKYDKEIKIVLVVLIGNFVKVICEYFNQNSWFMMYEKNFDIEIILDNEKVISLPVKAI